MGTNNWNQQIQAFDDRRDIVIPGDREATLKFCAGHFQKIANKAIKDHGFFAVALSGGSTPKAIFEKLVSPENLSKIEWSKLLVFWSDERSVPMDHPDSNYHMAMEAGLKKVPIPSENVFRMEAEGDIEANAKAYEHIIKGKLPRAQFDLVMLGMGDDGHTASLFPRTHGLHTNDRLAIANYVPQKNTWRMSFTYDCINSAAHIAMYVLGKSKAAMVQHVLSGPYEPDELPAQRVGTPAHKALWILDAEAASLLQ